MTPRRTAAAVALVLSTGLVAGPQVSAGAASAGPDSCVSKKEYRKIKQGMTRPDVKRISGTNGTSLGRIEVNQDLIIKKRRYRVCTSAKGSATLGFVSVMGGRYKLTRKTVDWR